MSVKEVSMVPTGMYFERNIKYVLSVFYEEKRLCLHCGQNNFKKYHADFWIRCTSFYGRSFDHALDTNIIRILLCWVNINC